MKHISPKTCLERVRRLLGRWRVALLCLCAGSALAVATVLLWPMQARGYLKPEPSGEMQDRAGRLLHAFLNARQQWCFERELNAMSPRLLQATIAAEDQRFYRHGGVDFIALARAAWQDLRRMRIVSGASTLTMQIVKSRQSRRGAFRGKICQIVQALRLERRASKEQILRAYLNNMPYGLNLVGCEAASWRYFGKPSLELTLPEAALVAGLPKAPTAFMPLQHPQRALRRRNHVLRRMQAEGFVTQAELDAALKAPIGVAWHELPVLSPHLAMRLRPALQNGNHIRTTLDFAMQSTAEEIVRKEILSYGGEIGNAAAIIVDASSRRILARVGSADFFRTAGGQVDSIRARRSPGSALKPFIYALAMERNCLYPTEMLLDAPADYGLYSPENFDRTYRGLVPAGLALRRSLNMPALTILQRVGVDTVCGFLEEMKLGKIRKPAEEYGLGLVLGNCEVQLEQLASAYCMLANLGTQAPLSILDDAPTSAPVRRLSTGVCAELYEMLRQPLPGNPADDNVRIQDAAPPVCWKTGTSTGYHDAWAMVFNRHYVVGVWMGNNDGRPSDRLVGIRAALPMASALFRSLPPRGEPAWPDTLDTLRPVAICTLSGLPVSNWCPHSSNAFLPKTQFLHRICDVHSIGSEKAVGVSPERWPATVADWDLARIRNVATTPGTDPDDTEESKDHPTAEQDKALHILNPPQGAQFILTGEKNGDQVVVKSSVDARSTLHWYLDDTYVGSSTSQKPVRIALKPGVHQLSCMTPEGVTDKAQFEVLEREPDGFLQKDSPIRSQR